MSKKKDKKSGRKQTLTKFALATALINLLIEVVRLIKEILSGGRGSNPPTYREMYLFHASLSIEEI